MEKTPAPATVRVVGVRFRTAGRIYYFDPGDFALTRGSDVIVETARGIEYGFVVGPPMEVSRKNIQQPLKAVVRLATPEDDERMEKNLAREREAFQICRERIRRRNLDMKLIDAECTFDNSKILFYFTADGRVDFRDLVKDLAGVFRTRIELRQVGVRDEAKILGGYGSCGRPLCCHTWLSEFIPVSIKMAKEQSLSLNPGKISGVCGRLMCCLKNEAETYEELNRILPRPGDEVASTDGLVGLIESVNVLRQRARIIVEVDDEKELHEYDVRDLEILHRRRRGASRPTMQRVPGQKNIAKDHTRATAREGREALRDAGAAREGREAFRDTGAAREGREAFRDTGAAREGREALRDAGAARESREGGRRLYRMDTNDTSGTDARLSRKTRTGIGPEGRGAEGRDSAETREDTRRERPERRETREEARRERPERRKYREEDGRERPERVKGRKERRFERRHGMADNKADSNATSAANSTGRSSACNNETDRPS